MKYPGVDVFGDDFEDLFPDLREMTSWDALRRKRQAPVVQNYGKARFSSNVKSSR